MLSLIFNVSNLNYTDLSASGHLRCIWHSFRTRRDGYAARPVESVSEPISTFELMAVDDPG